MIDNNELIARLEPFVGGLGKAILREAAYVLEAQAREIEQHDIEYSARGLLLLDTERERDQLRAELAAIKAQEPVALPMDTAPTGGEIVRLLVDFEGNSLEDTDQPVWTVGACYASDSEGDVWQFAGWNWTHDHFTEGHGKPIGWLPLHAAQVAPAQPVNAELVEALKDALRSMESFAVSCQDGVVTSCKCRACVLARGNAALANAKAAPQQEQKGGE